MAPASEHPLCCGALLCSLPYTSQQAALLQPACLGFRPSEMFACHVARYCTAEPEPVSEEVAALMAEQGVDLETSGLKYLSNDARVSAGPATK